MQNYKNYYKEFLGIDEKELKVNKVNIFKSEYRVLPICQNHYFPIIITQWNNIPIISCLEEYFQLFQQKEIKSIEDFKKEISLDIPDIQWINYKRYAFEQKTLSLQTNSVPLDLDLYLKISKNKDISLLPQAHRILIEERKLFVIIQENRILSQAYESDVFSKSGNISVNTFEQFRNKGYGKEVVKGAVNYSLNHDHLPIYMVKEANIASIRVAESVGFSFKSNECCGYLKK